jgi:rare lipoprotein A
MMTLDHRARLGWAAAPAPAVVAMVVLAAAVLLGGCANRPPGGRDGPDAHPPPGLEQVPDAEPRVEPLRVGGPNKPYEAYGQSYVPMTADLPLFETGLASWYGRKYHGKPTASGETYDMYAMTAAHRTMPIPSYARVRNPANGREVIVRINDRGPFSSGRVIDLSYTAALKLGVLAGVAPVEVQRITHREIRAGLWSAAPARPTLPPDDAAPGDPVPAGAGFWIQLGAFRARDGATLQQQYVLREAVGLQQGVAVFEESGVFRVQAGPFASREQARDAAENLRAQLGIAVVVVERR